MRKKYTYDNAIVYVMLPDDVSVNFRKATERFLKRVMAEKRQKGERIHGDINTCRNFREK